MTALIDDPADNETLMAALGRIALRSTEFAEAVDDVVRQLNPAKKKKSRQLMLSGKLDVAKKIAVAALSCNPELRDRLISFFEQMHLLVQERNSAIHSTFLENDVEGGIIKWDTKRGLEPILITDLSQIAKRLEVKTRLLRQLRHEIRGFQTLRPLSESA